MEAKTFISKKHDAAVEELKALEAEYKPKMDAAKAKIDLSKKWLEELESEVEEPAAEKPLLDEMKPSTTNWVSARDLTPPARQGM